MTVDAIVPHTCERQRIVGEVAVHTAQVAMCSGKREPVLFMQLRDIIHQPGPGGVASGAVVADGHRVNIGMAGDAIRRDRRIEQHGAVAGLAIHLRVHANQRKRCGIMIEAQRIAHHDPAIRNVASCTVDLEVGSVRRLAERQIGH